MSARGSPVDWRDDEALTAQIRRMDRAQRHQAVFLALRRLQAPLVDIEMPGDWGVDPAAVDSLLRCGAARLDGEPDDAFRQALARLSRAPLFESEVDPELAESFQLEAIGGWLLVGEALGEMSEDQTDGIVLLARAQADHLDGCIDDTLMAVGDEGLRERWLAQAGSHLRAYGLGYFATRNLEVEGRCHEVVLAASAGGDLLASEAGRELLNMCDDYSSEVASALRAFPT
ncbi:hypothetical protein [Streptomyces sp. enrichment culture]|uniref:hypothetical protein n=1 Tax=Streptomyces sp. enrichment culture TaxID=1795815 RepID=UPI003F55C991